ncbi:hypothetical protein CDD80_7273 [Ophiocordyceps camponoti-rufipedis]|uniref:Uncharacterized protein n=1 Tax=Ophiocordyceps camponoti-rufipedis TaxID=2004952 RepID=A0A2C5YM23_9HYPO|nr:hypothetical protein CDD80_7273 [Ophiocordyceps camponoti-rufipedis]
MDRFQDLAEYQVRIPTSVQDPIVAYDPRWRQELEPWIQEQKQLITERHVLGVELQRVWTESNEHSRERDRIKTEIRELTRRKIVTSNFLFRIRPYEPGPREVLLPAAYYLHLKREIANLYWDRNRVDEYLYMTSVARVQVEDKLRRNAEACFFTQFTMHARVLAAQDRLDPHRFICPHGPELYLLNISAYLQLLQSLLLDKTRPCPSEAAMEETINPYNCFAPKRIIPWLDFAQKQDGIWATIMASEVAWSAEYPPKVHLMFLFSKITRPISNDSEL